MGGKIQEIERQRFLRGATTCRGREGLAENLLAEGRPWMKPGRKKPCRYLQRRALTTEGTASAKALRKEYACV